MVSKNLLNDEVTYKKCCRAYQLDMGHALHSWAAQKALASVVVTETTGDLTSSHRSSTLTKIHVAGFEILDCALSVADEFLRIYEPTKIPISTGASL